MNKQYIDSVENSRTIYIKEKAPTDGRNECIYTKNNKQAIFNAMKNLSARTF